MRAVTASSSKPAVTGPAGTDLDRCWQAYIHRLDIEHTIKFEKQDVRLILRCDNAVKVHAAPTTASLPSPRGG